MDQVCKNCKHNRYNWKEDDFFCNNRDSEDYLDFITSDHHCENWEEKEK